MRNYFKLLLLFLICISLQNCEEQNFEQEKESTSANSRSIDQTTGENQVIIRYDQDYSEETKELLRFKYSSSINFTIDNIEYAEWDSRLELWNVSDQENGSDINVNDLITSMKTKEFDEGDLEESTNSLVKTSTTTPFFIPSTNSNMSNHLVDRPGIVIAIIDSGLDYGQLSGKYLHKSSDNDTEAISGWDFVNDDNDIRDDFGHGTHIAKIIMEEMLQHHVRPEFVPLKAFNHEGKTNLFQLLKALSYVNAHENIDILNMSLGWIGDTKYLILNEIISEISENTLVICSAGNDGMDTDPINNTHFPSGLSNPQILSVAGYSINNSGQIITNDQITGIEKAPWSNYGKIKVDLFAPFDEFNLTYSDKPIPISLEGTSYSAAFASARAAILHEPEILIPYWKDQIIESGFVSLALKNKCQTSSAILRNEINGQ